MLWVKGIVDIVSSHSPSSALPGSSTPCSTVSKGAKSPIHYGTRNSEFSPATREVGEMSGQGVNVAQPALEMTPVRTTHNTIWRDKNMRNASSSSMYMPSLINSELSEEIYTQNQPQLLHRDLLVSPPFDLTPEPSCCATSQRWQNSVLNPVTLSLSRTRHPLLPSAVSAPEALHARPLASRELLVARAVTHTVSIPISDIHSGATSMERVTHSYE
jgi:hypothetical protein